MPPKVASRYMDIHHQKLIDRSAPPSTGTRSASSPKAPILMRKKSDSLVNLTSQASTAEARDDHANSSEPKVIKATLRSPVLTLDKNIQALSDQILSPSEVKLSVTSSVDVSPTITKPIQLADIEITAPSEFPPLASLLQATRQSLREILAGDGLALSQAESWVRNDPELVEIAMKQNIKAFYLASESLKTTAAGRKLIELVLQKGELDLQKAPEWVRDDDELVKIVISTRGSSLKYASKRLREDPSIIQMAIRENGLAIAFANRKALEANRHLIFEAIKQNPGAYALVISFLVDEATKIQAMQASGLALRYINSEYQTLNIVLAALNNNLQASSYVKEELKNHPEVVKLLSPSSPASCS